MPAMPVRLQTILPVLVALAIPPLCAQEAEKPASVPRTLEQAEAQLQRAETMRDEAQRRYAAEEAACYRKILVGGCLEDAKERHMEAIIEARALEISAREFKRVSRRAEVEEEKSRQAAERPAREAGQQERAERYRTEEAAKATEREQRRLDRERKAEEKRQKLAKTQAERKLKADKRAKRHAEQIEKKARQRAEAEEKAARDKTPDANER
jgi:hypothetical protein